jgi:Ni,Fe-hydrogenase III small subunit/ferredoxin
MPWIARGLRHGIVTTSYPRRPDGYDKGFRGAVVALNESSDSEGNASDTAGLVELCPTGAIAVSDTPAAVVQVDRGRCILCGRCVAIRPDRFAFEPAVEVAALSRRALIVPQSLGTEADIGAVRAALYHRVRALRRSVHIRHVDAGSDGAEEVEIAALTGPIYDIQRLGMYFTATPRHADVLLATGVGTAGMVEELKRTFEAMPDPKVVIAAGTDAASGGLVGPTYSAGAGIGTVLPVDVLIPGSPPSPFSLLHGLLVAVGLLPDRGGAK